MPEISGLSPGDVFDPRFEVCGFFPDDLVYRQPRAVLTDGQKLLYGILLRLFRMYGQCFPSHGFLAEATGKSERQIRYDLERLEALKLILGRRRRRQSTVYEILFHEWFLERQSAASQEPGEAQTNPFKNGNPLPVKEAMNGSPLPLKNGKNGSPKVLERQSSVSKNGNPLPTNPCINPIEENSSSSSEAVPAVQQEDDEDGAPVLKNTTPDPEDVSELVRFIGSALKASTGETVAVSTGDARRTRARAPGWTITEIIEAFAAYAKGGSPRSVHWFPEVLTDIHERLEGKPPVIPERCAHGLVVGEQCEGCEHDETERQNAKRRRQEAELEAQGICPACRNSGRIKSRQFGWEAPCERCEAGRQLRAREDAEEQRRNKLADRFEPLSRRIDKLPDVKKPWEIIRIFAAGDADRREAICTALERECSAQTIAELLQPRDERKSA